MRLYIKDLQPEALALFRAFGSLDYPAAEAAYDAGLAANKAALGDVLDGLMTGRYDYAFARHGDTLWTYTRSTRGNWIQISHFCRLAGEWEACSHHDAHDAEEMEALPGCWLNVSVNRSRSAVLAALEEVAA